MPAKQFATLAESKEFIDALPPCAIVKRRFNALGECTVDWEPLRLRLMGDPDKLYPVHRETEHAYLVRNEQGGMTKVSRYTLMGASQRFELE